MFLSVLHLPHALGYFHLACMENCDYLKTVDDMNNNRLLILPCISPHNLQPAKAEEVADSFCHLLSGLYTCKEEQG